MHPIDTLKQLMAQLRDPQKGCPWDLEQNFTTIAPHTIEEAYEVADAIDKQDHENLREELGDLLFQVIFHSQLAQEASLFGFDEVVEAITQKMIARHPHIFGDRVIHTAKEQEEAWEKLKHQEREAKGKQYRSVLSGVPVGLPAMVRALKLQKKAAKVGFDWPDIQGAWKKMLEEVAELEEAMRKKDQIAEELGDVLFSLINVARKLSIDPEEALRKTNRKFEQRFSYIEQALKASGTSIEDSNLAQMDVLWEEAKGEKG